MASNFIAEDADLEQLCSITGVKRDVGARLLEACNGNLQLAIEMHVDGGGESCDEASAAVGGASASAVDQDNDESDEVRAPIPQKSETLVEEMPAFALPGQHYGDVSDDEGLGFRGRRRKARSVFDGFRDFQAEARQQEEMLRTGASTSTSKRKTLEDLFRPPIDITYKGSFANVRESGTQDKKWLLVNIQNVQEFTCQALNRDLWSNLSVKALIKSHFLFWQVYHDSEEGTKFRQFYKVNDWPYIAIIDPRTGESMISWNKMDPTSFSEIVTDFIAEHPFSESESDSSPVAAKRPRVSSIVDATEDAQLQAAINASLAKNSVTDPVVVDSDSSESDDLETFTDSEDDSESCHSSPVKKDMKFKKVSENSNSPSDKGKQKLDSNNVLLAKKSSEISNAQKTDNTSEKNSSKGDNKSHEQYLGKEDDPQTSLMIRFPDGNRQQWSVSCESKLMSLVLFVAEKGFSNERYELVTNFPRRKLSYMDFDMTLKDAGLHPQESIFVQAR